MPGQGRSYPTEGGVNLRAVKKHAPPANTPPDPAGASDIETDSSGVASVSRPPVVHIAPDEADVYVASDAERAEQRPNLPELGGLLPDADSADSGPARWGLRGYLNAVTRDALGLGAGTPERTARAALAAVRQQWIGHQRIMVANPKGGEGCTVCALMMGHVFAEQRGAGIVVWDNTETEGTLGSRAVRGSTAATVWDLIDHAAELAQPGAEMAELSRYLRLQPSRAEVLAADESQTGRGQITADHDRVVDALLRRHRQMSIIDTGHNRLRSNWLWTAHVAHLLVIPMTYREDSAIMVCRMLDGLYAIGLTALINNAIVVLTDPPAKTEPRLQIAIQKALQRKGIRNLVEVPWDPILAGGGSIDHTRISETSRAAWIQVCAMAATSLALSSHRHSPEQTGESTADPAYRPAPSGHELGLEGPFDADMTLNRSRPPVIRPLGRSRRGA